MVHNTDNILVVDEQIHQKISGFYNSNLPNSSIRVRDWLASQSFENQYDFGIQVLKNLSVIQ